MRRAAQELDADLVLDTDSELGEGPTWDDTRAELIWVDISGRTVHRYRPSDGRHSSMVVPLPVGSVALAQDGSLLLALANGFWLASGEGSQLRPFCLVALADGELRFNDGKCDPGGRFWSGTITRPNHPGEGHLYRLHHDGELFSVLNGITISNGLGWSPDASAMYYVDSPRRRIDRFDYDLATGAIADRRVLVTISDEQPGLPDGLAVDAVGGLWVAMWKGSTLQYYSPEGHLEAVVNLPVSRVTSCAFGGAGLSQLYITTARFGASSSELGNEPYAGSLFRITAPHPGLPVARFAFQA